jgi:hypothetical protein
VVLNENLYRNSPQTLEELKQNADLLTSDVTAETLQWVASEVRNRVNERIAESGGLFWHLI